MGSQALIALHPNSDSEGNIIDYSVANGVVNSGKKSGLEYSLDDVLFVKKEEISGYLRDNPEAVEDVGGCGD